ncbi:MAG: radical SAM protein, partial [Acidobacteriota bacterium]
ILDEVIGKKISLQQVREVTRWCYELGIKTNPFFIFSHPEETEEDIEQTMDMMRNWPAHSNISLSLLHIYPGTLLEATAKEKGFLPADFSWAKKDQRGVITLPSAQGNVPIFVDKLSWEYLSRLMFEWAEGQRYRVLNKIPRAIKSIRTYSDFKRYMTMFKSFIKVKFNKLLSHGSARSR